MKVFLAEYCPCSYRSAFGVIAVCATRALAVIKMKQHKKKNTFFWRANDSSARWRVRQREVREK